METAVEATAGWTAGDVVELIVGLAIVALFAWLFIQAARRMAQRKREELAGEEPERRPILPPEGEVETPETAAEPAPAPFARL